TGMSAWFPFSSWAAILSSSSETYLPSTGTKVIDSTGMASVSGTCMSFRSDRHVRLVPLLVLGRDPQLELRDVLAVDRHEGDRLDRNGERERHLHELQIGPACPPGSPSRPGPRSSARAPRRTCRRPARR